MAPLVAKLPTSFTWSSKRHQTSHTQRGVGYQGPLIRRTWLSCNTLSDTSGKRSDKGHSITQTWKLSIKPVQYFYATPKELNTLDTRLESRRSPTDRLDETATSSTLQYREVRPLTFIYESCRWFSPADPCPPFRTRSRSLRWHTHRVYGVIWGWQE